jgi:hypothetical protein
VAGGGKRRVLLLSGHKSPRYSWMVMGELRWTVQNAKNVELEGVGHEVLCNAEMRESPAKAVEVLKGFLRGKSQCGDMKDGQKFDCV